MPQRARTFQVNCCLKVHNAHLKLLLKMFAFVTFGRVFNNAPTNGIKFPPKSVSIRGFNYETNGLTD